MDARANATYKTGIAFHGSSARTPSDFHPFQTIIDRFAAPAFFDNTHARRTGHDVPAHPDRFFIPAWLAHLHRSHHHQSPYKGDRALGGLGWGIPLANRTGNGCSSRYLSPGAAEVDLRPHLGLCEV